MTHRCRTSLMLRQRGTNVTAVGNMSYIKCSRDRSKNLSSSTLLQIHTSINSTQPKQSINMSDLGRKGLGDQVKEKATPDSQKSTLDKATESLTGAGDRAASAVQPNSDKSATQKLGDSTRSGTDNASNQGQGILQGAQDTLSNAGQSISDTLGGKK
ncbi:unnamed protein product [Periconia digitata]|uniref:Uncharacterized protein n=1 Tax=Periconia digitata TaxID=1303443 RepID=A0A9W4U334_9PLEO|nr:unnamed protein product [Periconia digitata]